ncbi:hypothetical protein C2845_PM08G00230 [Panicum miliaceum]|uniref:F-box domain-containing protein n=1 Tax=Panicum miliaceum TaxID=4540 RepID=A0A3L6R405_PANMI|nr:hypothetical protein C2845_PM08G00230 [Panicum miliaceum]
MLSSSRRRRRRKGHPPPSPLHVHDGAASRNRKWAALPDDVQLAIFSFLPQAGLLSGAGLVCASWRRVAVDIPVLWQHIDVASDEDQKLTRYGMPEGRLAMARTAVDRSAGRCESYRGPTDPHFLVYLAARYLAVAEEPGGDLKYFLDKVIAKLPMLERLVLRSGLILKATLLDAGGCFMTGRAPECGPGARGPSGI